MASNVNSAQPEADVWRLALTSSLTDGDGESLGELLSKGSVPFNATCPWKEGSPVGTLETAIGLGAAPELVQRLLDAKAAPTVFEKPDERSALDNVLRNKKYPDGLVVRLLDAKAQPTQLGALDGSPCSLDFALQGGRSTEILELFSKAIDYATFINYSRSRLLGETNEDLEEAQKQTKEERSEQSQQKIRDCNFHLAIVNKKNAKTLRLLLDQKAQPTSQNFDAVFGFYPKKRREKIVRLLLNAGVKPTESSLNHALFRGPDAAVSMLLRSGVRVSQESSNLLEDAIQSGRSAEVLQQLIDAGGTLPETAIFSALARGSDETVIRFLLGKGQRLDSKLTLDEIPVALAAIEKPPYSPELMQLLESTLPLEMPMEAPAEQLVEPPALEQPDENHQAGEREFRARYESLGEERGFLSYLLAPIIGLCSCIGSIFSCVYDFFFSEDEDL